MPRKTKRQKMRALKHKDQENVKVVSMETITIKKEKIESADPYETMVTSTTKKDIVKTLFIITAIFIAQAFVFFSGDSLSTFLR